MGKSVTKQPKPGDKPCKYGHLAGRLPNRVCRECDRLRGRGWRLHNKSHMREYNVGYRMENRADVLIFSAKRRATAKNLAFDLDAHAEHYREIMDVGLCQVTALPFKFDLTGRRSPFAPSFDRIEPGLGYVHGNVRVVLWGLNAALADWGEKAYAQIAEAFLRQSRK